MNPLRAAVATALLACLVPSCSTVGFYAQAMRGQWEVQSKAQPIARVLAQPALPETTRTRLRAVPGLVAFADHQLGLPSHGSYTTYADLGRRHVVWVVFAAGEFSIDAMTWRYPLAGSLAYRGYFSEKPALALQQKLTRQGLETYVAGVDAYSTLGLLPDPVLNTFIDRSETAVAELIFHELTHHRIHLKSDTEFNEALATAYSEHGVRRWLASRQEHTRLRHYTAQTRARRAFVQLALATRTRLAASYRATTHLPPAHRRAAKNTILLEFKQQALGLRRHHPQLTRLDSFFAEPVTNARLATLATYYHLVPAIETLIARHPSDPEAFFAEIELLSRLPKKERTAALESLAAPKADKRSPKPRPHQSDAGTLDAASPDAAH